MPTPLSRTQVAIPADARPENQAPSSRIALAESGPNLMTDTTALQAYPGLDLDQFTPRPTTGQAGATESDLFVASPNAFALTAGEATTPASLENRVVSPRSAGILPPSLPAPSPSASDLLAVESLNGFGPSPPTPPSPNDAIEVTVPYLDIVVPDYIPVNANNDNGSVVTFGIPVKRDFNVAPLPVPDPQLEAVTIRNTFPPGGTYSLSWSIVNGGQVAFWTDQTKSDPWPTSWLEGTRPNRFFIEGVHESVYLDDVQIHLTYSWAGNEAYFDQGVTVTPVIDAFTVQEAPRQNVRFANRRDILAGMTAMTLLNNPGINFDAILIVDELPGEPAYVQNLTGMINGANGTSVGGNAAAATYINGRSWSIMRLKNGSLPLVDGDPSRPNNPEYPADKTNDGHIATLKSNDSPDLTPPPAAGSSTTIDYKRDFKLYLTWKYSDGTFYALANQEWSANFFAKGDPAGFMTNLVLLPHGVTVAAGGFVRSNTDPFMDTTYFYNGNVEWKPL